jgi:hypothetical protein
LNRGHCLRSGCLSDTGFSTDGERSSVVSFPFEHAGQTQQQRGVMRGHRQRLLEIRLCEVEAAHCRVAITDARKCRWIIRPVALNDPVSFECEPHITESELPPRRGDVRVSLPELRGRVRNRPDVDLLRGASAERGGGE